MTGWKEKDSEKRRKEVDDEKISFLYAYSYAGIYFIFVGYDEGKRTG